MREVEGIGTSPGIAIGPAFQFRRIDLSFERTTIEEPITEWRRFQDALTVAQAQLEEVYTKSEAESGEEHAAIFEAQAMMLEDPELLGFIRRAIEEQSLNAEAALSDAAEQYAQMLEALDDEYLSARAADVRDVADRILRILLSVAETPTANLKQPSIILARDLTPSDTVMLDKELVLGFCIAEGGATSHTAILARGLGLPAVVGAGRAVLDVPDGETLILDGVRGRLLVEPGAETLDRYQARQKAAARVMAEARSKAHKPAVTEDGHPVEVVANIGNVTGAKKARAEGAEGVGLLRTEFLYLERDELPDEEEQYEAYRDILEVFDDQPVILRTLDVGGDKELPYLEMEEEMNPFLGVRAIRLSLRRPEIFKPQLRAALRAGVDHNLKLMFPMVATLSEVQQARALLETCREELRAEGHAVIEEMEVGVMIEVPAAAIMADQLAQAVDFFSIGTNDLSQYTMAVDRTNADLVELISAFQPAVLRLVSNVIKAAHKRGKWVGLCGEMAGEPLAIPILLGLGLDEFSMNPPAIPIAKQLIRTLNLEQAQQLAQDVLKLENHEAVKALVRQRVPEVDIR
jgi:phosphotransferase system enzyme I (PtsI)